MGQLKRTSSGGVVPTRDAHCWEGLYYGNAQKGGTMERLWGLYEHWCMEELISLREFVTRLKAGEFGAFNRDDVVGFLRDIEANMLENIEIKAMENPMLEELKEERMAETSQEIDELIADWNR
jgi:hypothetical protein